MDWEPYYGNHHTEYTVVNDYIHRVRYTYKQQQ